MTTNVELYHNALSTCSQKVRLVLDEKSIEFDSHDVDLVSGAQHDSDYVKLNPKHVVPTLLHDGHVLCESTLINEYIADAFDGARVTPTEPAALHAMRMWTKRVDENIHPMTGVITFAIGARPIVLGQPAEVREANIAAIPDAAGRARRRSVIEHGVRAPEVAGAIETFSKLCDDIDVALAGREWLAGDAWSLADAAMTPYILRLDSLAMTPLLDADRRPNLAAWYDRVRARPNYELAVTKWVPESVFEMFRGFGKEAWPEVEKLLPALR
jgi:glutathione S-transferase